MELNWFQRVLSADPVTSQRPSLNAERLVRSLIRLVASVSLARAVDGVMCCFMRAVGHWIGSQRFPSDVIARMTFGRMEYGVHGSPSDVVVGKSHVVMQRGAFLQRRLRCRLRHGVIGDSRRSRA